MKEKPQERVVVKEETVFRISIPLRLGVMCIEKAELSIFIAPKYKMRLSIPLPMIDHAVSKYQAIDTNIKISLSCFDEIINAI